MGIYCQIWFLLRALVNTNDVQVLKFALQINTVYTFHLLKCFEHLHVKCKVSVFVIRMRRVTFVDICG